MRTLFIDTTGDEEATDYTQAPGQYIDADGDVFNTIPGIVVHDAPWATIVVEVEGGYICFESVVDCNIWQAQI